MSGVAEELAETEEIAGAEEIDKMRAQQLDLALLDDPNERPALLAFAENEFAAFVEADPPTAGKGEEVGCLHVATGWILLEEVGDAVLDERGFHRTRRNLPQNRWWSRVCC